MTGTTDLVKIGSTVIEPLVSFSVEPNKLWTDAARNMNGDVRARLIGIFPKLKLGIGYTTSEQMETLRGLLDDDFFSVTYYDEKKGTTVTADYYAGNYEYGVFSKHRGLYEPFEVNLIPVKKEV